MIEIWWFALKISNWKQSLTISNLKWISWNFVAKTFPLKNEDFIKSEISFFYRFNCNHEINWYCYLKNCWFIILSNLFKNYRFIPCTSHLYYDKLEQKLEVQIYHTQKNRSNKSLQQWPIHSFHGTCTSKNVRLEIRRMLCALCGGCKCTDTVHHKSFNKTIRLPIHGWQLCSSVEYVHSARIHCDLHRQFVHIYYCVRMLHTHGVDYGTDAVGMGEWFSKRNKKYIQQLLFIGKILKRMCLQTSTRAHTVSKM